MQQTITVCVAKDIFLYPLLSKSYCTHHWSLLDRGTCSFITMNTHTVDYFELLVHISQLDMLAQQMCINWKQTHFYSFEECVLKNTVRSYFRRLLRNEIVYWWTICKDFQLQQESVVNPLRCHPLVCGQPLWRLEFGNMAAVILTLFFSHISLYLGLGGICIATSLSWLDMTENPRARCSSSCQSRGSLALRQTLLYHLFFSKRHRNLQNEHHAVSKKTWNQNVSM